jgi:hypothetical protein
MVMLVVASLIVCVRLHVTGAVATLTSTTLPLPGAPVVMM